MTERVNEQVYRQMRALERRVNSRNEYSSMHTGTAVPDHTAAEGVFFWDTVGDDLYVNSDGATAWQYIAGGSGAASHQILSSTHLDSTAAAVQRGDLMSGQGTATITWQRLAHPGAAGYALTTDADDVVWDQTPTWTGDHTWDDDAGDSPAIHFVGGSNDDTFSLWLEDDGTAGDSDFVVKFPAADTDSRFIWRDEGDSNVAYVDAAGNADFEAHLAVGASAGISANTIVAISDATVDTASTYYGLQLTTTKTAGATDEADEWVGLAFTATLNQAGGTVGDTTGIYGIARLKDGNVGSVGTPKDMRAMNIITDLNGGQVWQDAYGITVFVDQEAANTVSGTANGIRIRMDMDGTTTGAVRMLYLNERSGVDWAIYHDSDADSKLGGDTKIGGDDTILAQLHVDQSSASGGQPVLLLDQGDVSEQHIVCSMDGADQDFPAILQLDVTGAPTLAWDESDNSWDITDDFSLVDGDLHFASGLGIIHADGVAAGLVLGGDGTRFIPIAANANYPIPPGARGHIIRGEAGPVWASYDASTEGGVLIGDGTDIISDTSPTLVGNLSMDDGAGDSPSLNFVGGSNDDTFSLWLEDDGTAGDSDFVVKFPASDTDSQFIWRDSGDADVAYVDADGNADFLGHIAAGPNASVIDSIILNLQNTALDTTTAASGIDLDLAKTAGATDHDDALLGMSLFVRLNQSGGTIGHARGFFAEVQIDDGSVGAVGNKRDAQVGYYNLDLNAGTVTDDAVGIEVFVDQEAANTVSGDVFGNRIVMDCDGTVTGNAYGLYIDERTGINYGVYQDGTAQNILRGFLSVGTTGTGAALDVDQSSASGGQPVLLLDQGDVSEQHIICSMDGADQDFPAILQLDVTGAPTLAWDESDDKWTLTKHLSLLDGDLYIASGLGIIHADGVAAGAVLVGDGTRYIPGTFVDIGAAPADAQYLTLALDGDLSAERRFVPGNGLAGTDSGANGDYDLVVDLVAAWSGLEFSGGDLRIDLDATFDAWTGVHTHTDDIIMDDGSGNSPLLYFITGSDDEIKLLADDTNGDFRLLLSEAAGVSSFLVQDSAGGFAFGVDSNGNATVGNELIVPQYIIHSGDTDTYVNFTDDEITFHVGGADLLTLTEAANDTAAFVLAGAGGELSISINGAEDFTFTANSLDVLSGSFVTMADDTGIGLGAAAGRITFDDQGTDQIEFQDAHVIVGGTAPDALMTASLTVLDNNIGVSNDGSAAVYQAFAYGADAADYPIFRGRRAQGTRGTPTAAQSGDILGRLGAGGYGATGFAAASTGFVQVDAAENFTDAAMGTSLGFYTAPTSSVTAAERMRVAETGRVKIADSFTNTLAQLHVDQSSAAGGIEVLLLDQADVDEAFVHYYGEAAAGNLTRSIVDEGDQSSETRAGWLKVYVTDTGNQIADQAYFIPIYTLS